MKQIRYPCACCEPNRFCTFCCSIGIKYISARDPKPGWNRDMAIQKYREYQNGEK